MIGDRPCGMYAPGHQVHFIQAKKAAADFGVPAEVLGVEGDAVVLAVGDELRLYGNHHPRRILVLANEDQHVVLVERWHVLRIGSGGRRTLFSLAEGGPPVNPCGPPPD